MKYRKKPVVIEAIQYTGNNYEEIRDFVGKILKVTHITPYIPKLIIETLEGDHIVSVNDFVIKGVHGEFYACKPDIFRETYEEVFEDET